MIYVFIIYCVFLQYNIYFLNKKISVVNDHSVSICVLIWLTSEAEERPGAREGQWHHFRNSKLTMVLGHALAGNSQTAVVGTVSPAQNACEDRAFNMGFTWVYGAFGRFLEGF